MQLVGEIVVGITLIAVSAIGAYVFNYFKHKRQSIDRNREDIEKLQDDLCEIKKILVILAKKLDKGSKKYHNDTDSDFEELVKQLLED